MRQVRNASTVPIVLTANRLFTTAGPMKSSSLCITSSREASLLLAADPNELNPDDNSSIIGILKPVGAGQGDELDASRGVGGPRMPPKEMIIVQTEIALIIGLVCMPP